MTQDAIAGEAATLEALIDEAWRFTYINGRKAGELGQQVLDRTREEPGHPARGMAWFHVAFARVRSGDIDGARAANEQARAVFLQHDDLRGELLCTEIDALHARANGRVREALVIHERTAARSAGVERAPIELYISCNSRAITRKLLGQTDETLIDFYAAQRHAHAVAFSTGPLINALVNIGGTHGDLFNLVDARTVSHEAMALSAAAQAWTAFAVAALNLIQVCDGLGAIEECVAVARKLIEHEALIPPGVIDQNTPMLAIAFLQVGDLAQADHWLKRYAQGWRVDGDSKSDWARAASSYALATGDVAAARRHAEERLAYCREHDIADQPYARMRLLQAATDACEAAGDAVSALRFLREAQRLYEELVGTGARARYVALQTENELVQAQRERDFARSAHEDAERDRAQLASLNAALEAKIAEAGLLQEQLREQALRDPLTRLHNRRYLHQTGADRIELARRQGSPVALALIDIDFFKRVNDLHGHEAGDQLLVAIADHLLDRLRRSDILCRYGGEEFVLLTNDTTPENAALLLQQVLASLARLEIGTCAGVLTGVTFSAGVAGFDGDGDTLAELLKVADRRMYQAKADGKARVRIR
jgi:two-component system cell cycle response regulator